MALHELATNAVKYGALSNAYGVVTLNWEVIGEEDAQSVRLTWRELGRRARAFAAGLEEGTP